MFLALGIQQGADLSVIGSGALIAREISGGQLWLKLLREVLHRFERHLCVAHSFLKERNVKLKVNRENFED